MLNITPNHQIADLNEFKQKYHNPDLSDEENTKRCLELMLAISYHLGHKTAKEEEPDKITYTNLLRKDFKPLLDDHNILDFNVKTFHYNNAKTVPVYPCIRCHFSFYNLSLIIIHLRPSLSLIINVDYMYEMDAIIKAFIINANY